MSAETFDTSHDHVVLLLDTPDFENPPAWLRDSFNIIEGGVHAGQLLETTYSEGLLTFSFSSACCRVSACSWCRSLPVHMTASIALHGT